MSTSKKGWFRLWVAFAVVWAAFSLWRHIVRLDECEEQFIAVKLNSAAFKSCFDDSLGLFGFSAIAVPLAIPLAFFAARWVWRGFQDK
ncbi:hypothetical protein G6N82_06845 [Altererythrobacter sp. BO-6]|nr:hypothetical protein G6N82_06845 [Altererythrobacter sp. BO-6]